MRETDTRSSALAQWQQWPGGLGVWALRLESGQSHMEPPTPAYHPQQPPLSHQPRSLQWEPEQPPGHSQCWVSVG